MVFLRLHHRVFPYALHLDLWVFYQWGCLLILFVIREGGLGHSLRGNGSPNAIVVVVTDSAAVASCGNGIVVVGLVDSDGSGCGAGGGVTDYGAIVIGML